MNRPLIASKLRRPQGRSLEVSRPRLTARLDQTLQARLTLVSAPAGFGKTTLLTQWLDRVAEDPDPPAVAWLSLDPHDDDPGTFWSYVIAALGNAVRERYGAEDSGEAPEIGAAALPLLQGQADEQEPALALLLNDLEAVARPVVLALDDYHVIGSREIHRAVAYLLDHLPPTVHLVLATRTDPPLPLPRLRVRGELVEVRAADLRFTRDEAGEYLSGPMRLELTPADVFTLADRTEGWAAALQLAGLSLQDRNDTAAAVSAFAGDDRFIVDYLADEVLARQPDDVREFLLRTSLLQRLTGPLCEAVTGQSGGAARLTELDRANLFLVPLDDRRQWYRYHHLFGDVLRAHLAERSPEAIPELHRRACGWLQAHGDLSGAVDHALAGGDHDRAADLMERVLPAMSRDRREPELARWVDVVPEAVLDRRPVLAVGLAGALAQVSSFATVEERLTAAERAVGVVDGVWPVDPPSSVVVVDVEGYRAMPATVQMYRAALALSRGDTAATIAHAGRALELAHEEHHLVRAGSGALGGLAAWATGDLTAAHAAYTESMVGMRRAGHLADLFGLAITLGDLSRTQGRLGAALRTYRETLDSVTEAAGATLRGAADMHVGIGGVLLDRGDVAAAAAELEVSDRLGELMGLPQNPYRSRVLRARLLTAAGDLDGALEQLDQADRVYNGDYAPNVAPVPATRARLRLRRGELSHAQAWVRERQLSADDDLTYVREYEHVTLARVLLAQHLDRQDRSVLESAIGLLERLADAADAGGRHGTLLEVLVLLALARAAAGDRHSALVALRRAVELGGTEGYLRVFTDEGRPLANLMQELVRERPTSSYLRTLVSASLDGVAAAPATVPGVDRAVLVEPLSERELDVLRLLATDLDGPDIARELHVSLNTMRTHSRNIFRKLQVSSRRAAVRQAAELNLLPTQRKP